MLNSTASRKVSKVACYSYCNESKLRSVSVLIKLDLMLAFDQPERLDTMNHQLVSLAPAKPLFRTSTPYLLLISTSTLVNVPVTILGVPST